MKNIDTLDGNGQLFLALQDLSMPDFLSKLDSVQDLKKNQDRKRVIVVFTDEEWDIKQLKNGFEDGITDRDTVIAHVHEVSRNYYETYKI